MFSAAQLRVFLRALVTIDPYAFDDVAEHLAANDDNNEQSSEEILLPALLVQETRLSSGQAVEYPVGG